MLYIPSWTTRTSWNHNYKLYVEARSRTDLIITFNVDSDIVCTRNSGNRNLNRTRNSKRNSNLNVKHFKPADLANLNLKHLNDTALAGGGCP